MEHIIDFAENRNIYMPSKKIKQCLFKSIKNVYEYPDYKNKEVTEAISNYFDVDNTSICITNGSLEAINLLPRILKKSNASIFKPTFWGYEDSLKRNEYNINAVLLDNELKYNLDKIKTQAKNADIIFICNPNNPTLDYINKDSLLNIIKNNENCHFIIDETMLIFDKDFFNKSLTKYVNEVNNLSIIISLSKFLGIAGLRTGILFSNSSLIKDVKNEMVPYSLGIIQQKLIPCALSDKEYLNKTRKLIEINKKKLCLQLKNIDCNVIDGNTNFILVKLPKSVDSNNVTDYLFKNNLIVRNIKKSYPELTGDYIRISVNMKSNNKLLIKKLKQSFYNH